MFYFRLAQGGEAQDCCPFYLTNYIVPTIAMKEKGQTNEWYSLPKNLNGIFYHKDMLPTAPNRKTVL